ncbi:MAG: tetratricopeptide repeat protein [Myxococcaceae bacterium]|nr:tetratricopeptide repeat protein [Myxococcaceae bacterium]
MRRSAVLVALAAVASHAPALRNGFTWLDHGDLEAGAALASPAQWLSLFTHGYARTGFYRPLTALSLSVDALAGAPWLFHATNLVLHAAAAVAVLFMASLVLERSPAVATTAGVLFAVHPVTSVVANQLTYRGDALMTLGLMVMLVGQARRRPLLAVSGLLLAALSKETGLVLGPLLALGWVASLPRERWRAEGASLLAVGGGLLAALALRLAFAPAWHVQNPALSALEFVGTRLASLGKSALALLAPVDPRVCDAFPVTLPWQPLALLGLGVGLALLVLAVRARPLGLWLGLALAPSLSLVPVPRFWSPHYLYLPLAFAGVLAAEALERTGRRWALQLLWAACAVLAVVSFVDSRRYRDDGALFGTELEGRAERREAQLYFGDARRAAGDLAAAAAAYRAAVTRTPGVIAYSDELAALQNLGLVQLQQEQYLEAELTFLEALERPHDERRGRELNHDLAAVALARGDPGGAEALLRAEAARSDAFPESLALFARALHALGRDDEARAVLERKAATAPSPPR